MTIPILYQDDALLIVDKPAELLTVPGRGVDKQDCLINRIKLDEPNARIVHRLDMSTSGIVIIAKHHQAQAAMGQLFERREIHKKYTAVVSGELKALQGEVNLPLISDWPNRPKQKIDYEVGKAAQTHYEVIKHDQKENITRITLTPITGRTHQLRVHMLALGHPILGDNLYAPDAIRDKSERLLLHACAISFIHPLDSTPVNINAAAPF